ncbi:MAG: riboflavin kinase, partial [Calditrichota bacterium]
FGKQRLGDRETLIALSKNLGFVVDVINPTRVNDKIISSTAIREALQEGRVADAAAGLGRYHAVKGTVVRGFGRGRRLNFPTANLGLIEPGKLCPRDGIYVGLAHVQGETHPAAISSGNNPTFAEAKHSVEAHLLDFDRDIYDEEIEIEFVDWIRNEKKFSGEAELSAQIAEDVRIARDMIAARGLVRRIAG